jgi:hypothetical protein
VRDESIPYGYCHCGCGGKTQISPETSNRDGWKKGEPRKFLHGHNMFGENHWGWRNGRQEMLNGYIAVLARDSHRANPERPYVYEHIVVAEKALGKALPYKAEVHHVNEVKHDNSNENLVICQDHSYHALLHLRREAYKACGNAQWRKCRFCQIWDDPKIMSKRGHHRECYTQHDRDRRARLMINA